MKTKTFRFAMLLLWGLSMSMGAWAQFSGGTGAAADPFQIKTADDLNNVRNYIGASHTDKHFRLMNNIDLTAFLQNYNEGWLPIGDNNNPFTGYFHGDGREIKGLWINRPTVTYVGLFGVSAGTIDSLGVVVSDKNIAGGSDVGGLVGYNSNQAKINQCYVTGVGTLASSNSTTGGFMGYNDGSVTNCYATNNFGIIRPMRGCTYRKTRLDLRATIRRFMDM